MGLPMMTEEEYREARRSIYHPNNPPPQTNVERGTAFPEATAWNAEMAEFRGRVGTRPKTGPTQSLLAGGQPPRREQVAGPPANQFQIYQDTPTTCQVASSGVTGTRPTPQVTSQSTPANQQQRLPAVEGLGTTIRGGTRRNPNEAPFIRGFIPTPGNPSVQTLPSVQRRQDQENQLSYVRTEEPRFPQTRRTEGPQTTQVEPTIRGQPPVENVWPQGRTIYPNRQTVQSQVPATYPRVWYQQTGINNEPPTGHTTNQRDGNQPPQGHTGPPQGRAANAAE